MTILPDQCIVHRLPHSMREMCLNLSSKTCLGTLALHNFIAVSSQSITTILTLLTKSNLNSLTLLTDLND